MVHAICAIIAKAYLLTEDFDTIYSERMPHGAFKYI